MIKAALDVSGGLLALLAISNAVAGYPVLAVIFAIAAALSWLTVLFLRSKAR